MQFIILLPESQMRLQGSGPHGEVLPINVPLTQVTVLDKLSRNFQQLVLLPLFRDRYPRSVEA